MIQYALEYKYHLNRVNFNCRQLWFDPEPRFEKPFRTYADPKYCTKVLIIIIIVRFQYFMSSMNDDDDDDELVSD